MPIRRSPTFVPVGPVWTRSPAALERRAGIEFAPRAFHVAAREFGALESLRVDDGAGVAGRAVGAVGARSENGQRFTACSRRASASARCVLRPPCPNLARQLYRGFAAPHQSIGGGGSQGFDECARHLLRLTVDTLAPRLEFEAVRLRCRHGRKDGRVDIGDDVTLRPVDSVSIGLTTPSR